MVTLTGFEPMLPPRKGGVLDQLDERVLTATKYTNFLDKDKSRKKRGIGIYGDPNRIRTGVTAVKGQCPRPLDDRAIKFRATEL